MATDHAPHAVEAKDCEWSAARPGMLGLQTALPVVVATMVATGLLDWRGVARVCSEAPARIAGLPDQGRPLAVGEPANLTLVDPDAAWTVRGAALASRADEHPVRGDGDAGLGGAHHAAGPVDGAGRKGAGMSQADTSRDEAVLVLEDGSDAPR